MKSTTDIRLFHVSLEFNSHKRVSKFYKKMRYPKLEFNQIKKKIKD